MLLFKVMGVFPPEEWGGVAFQIGLSFKTPGLSPARTVTYRAHARSAGLWARTAGRERHPSSRGARDAQREGRVSFDRRRVRRRQTNHEPTRRDGALLCPDRYLPIVANGPNPEPQLVIKFPQNRVARELGALAVNLSLNARNAELMCTNKGLYHLVARVERTKDPLLMKVRDDDDTGATQRRQGAPRARET